MPVLSVMAQLCLWDTMFGTADEGSQVGVWSARWGCAAMSSTGLGRSGHSRVLVGSKARYESNASL